MAKIYKRDWESQIKSQKTRGGVPWMDFRTGKRKDLKKDERAFLAQRF